MAGKLKKQIQFYTKDGSDIWELDRQETVTFYHLKNLKSGEDHKTEALAAAGFVTIEMPTVNKSAMPKRKYTKKRAQKPDKKLTPNSSAQKLPRGVSLYKGLFRAQINRAKQGRSWARSFDKLEDAVTARAVKLRELEGTAKTPVTQDNEFVYLCDGCGASYETHPGVCTKCMGGAFEAVSKGQIKARKNHRKPYARK